MREAPSREALDEAARELRSGGAAFTAGNLFHTVRRNHPAIDRASFDRALKKTKKGAIDGLLPSPCNWTPPPLPREWDAYSPLSVLVVDRPAILDLFVASGAIARFRIAVVCLDGTPSNVVDWLRRGFRRGRAAAIAYLHDSATIVYPFLMEPLATFVRHAPQPIAFRDLGFPPAGASGVRFEDPRIPASSLVFDLEELPPAVLLRYAVQGALGLVDGDPNMLPLSRERERLHILRHGG